MEDNGNLMTDTDRLIWTSHPNYEEYREDLMENFPDSSEEDLRDMYVYYGQSPIVQHYAP